ncbi:MAG: hypothetical protein ACI9AT_000472 [Ulvibacter sp.]|jgi:hypothetical protein
MKKTYQFFIIFLLLSCTKSEDTIEYPVSFVFDNVETGTFHYFVVEDPLPLEIVPAGTFLQFEPQLVQGLTIEEIEFSFDKFTLLNESEVQVSSLNLGNQGMDTTLNYIKIDNQLRIFFDEVNNDFFDIEYDMENNQLRFCMQSYFHSFINSFDELDYSPLVIEECTLTESSDLIASIVEDNLLELNDSVAINYSYLIFQ